MRTFHGCPEQTDTSQSRSRRVTCKRGSRKSWLGARMIFPWRGSPPAARINVSRPSGHRLGSRRLLGQQGEDALGRTRLAEKIPLRLAAALPLHVVELFL